MLGERYREACEQGWLDYPGKEHKETCPFATGLESKYQLLITEAKVPAIILEIYISKKRMFI